MNSINRGVRTGANSKLTIGDNASFGNTTIVGPALDELRHRGEAGARLTELERALAEHREALANADEVLEAVRRLAAELARKEPNHVTLRGMLAGIAGSVSSVAALAEAVQRLHAAIPGI